MERRHVERTFGLGELIRRLPGLVVVRADLDEFRAPAEHRGVLLDAVALGREHRHRHAARHGGEGHALAVVAARRRDHPARQFVGPGEFVQQHETAAHLERTGGRVVLVLHPDLAASAAAEPRPTVLRGRRHAAPHNALCLFQAGYVEH